MLKQAIMCQADTTLITMKWDPELIMPVANMSSQHECVDWDRLAEWSDPRSFDPRAKGWLVHPELGKVLCIPSDLLKGSNTRCVQVLHLTTMAIGKIILIQS